MILKKPYALFIKLFRPIHLVVCVLIAYLIHIESALVSVFNRYVDSNILASNYKSNPLLFVIPVFIIIVSIVFLTVMYRKNKPVKFYIVNILLFLVIIVVNVYSNRYALHLTSQYASIKAIKLVHDLSIINVIIECSVFSVFLVRGLGINIKKFDFSSDLTKFNVLDDDREEFELNINVLDTDLENRKRKRFRRKLKYLFAEHKKIVIILSSTILGFVLILIGIKFAKSEQAMKENQQYASYNLSFKINKSYLVNESFSGKELPDLVVIDANFSSNAKESILDIDDFSLQIDDQVLSPTIDYSKMVSDLGKTYYKDKLSSEAKSYLIVFKLPEKYNTKKMYLKYSSKYDSFKIKVNPTVVQSGSLNVSSVLGEKLEINEIGVSLTVSEFDISSSYKIDYSFCHKANDCMDSVEYLKPSIDKNFDKTILRVKSNTLGNSNVQNFYDLISNYGTIKYSLSSVEYTQSSDFEQIKSVKKDTGYEYIGIKSEIQGAESVSVVFDIRGSHYEYKLK